MAIIISTGSRSASAAVVDAQTSQPTSEPSIALSSSPTLVQLIDLCALQFGVDIEYNASDAPLAAKLTLRSAGEYTPQELWELTHRMLETKGRTTVLAPGVRRLYRVVQLNEASAATEPLATIPDPPPGYVVLRYPVQNAAPEAVLAALNEPRPPVWEAALSADRSGVVVGALTRRHDAVRRLVERLDAEAASVRITLIDVQHADPLAVLAAVNAAKERLPGELPGTLSQGPRPAELLLTAPESATPRWRSLVGQFDVPQSAETRTYPLPNFASDDVETLLEQIARQPGATGSGDAWKLVRNPLVGTLLVTATPAEHAKVAELLAQIASIPADQRRATRTFTVRNRNAEDLRESLSRLLGVSIGGTAADPAAAPAEGQPVRVAGTTPAAGSQAAGPELLLAVDPELNAIIAVGPPHLLDAASDLIARLDVRQPQVLLEVLLVSLSDGQSRDLGVELQARINDSGTLIGLGSLFGLSNISPGSSVPTVSGAGGTAVVLSPGDFSVVVRALQSVNRGRSLSRASTLVNNNESANLSNTVTVPYATTTLTDGNTITAFGGSEPAGTTITVSPQIAQGGFLVLDYNVSLSSFLGEATSDGLPPPSQSTSINSIATIPDGYSIVLGGLELLTESDADSKTPLLADLPILGNLFKSSSDSTSRTRFYVLIRASVLNDPGFERLKYYSDTVSEEADATLGWPTVEPRIIR